MYLSATPENMEIALAITKEHGENANVQIISRDKLSASNKSLKARHPDAKAFIFLSNIDVVCLCTRELEKYLEKLEKEKEK